MNDMIVAINGKLTSGMTILSFEVELEMSGRELLILVSRYKSPAQTKKRILQREEDDQQKLHSSFLQTQSIDWIAVTGSDGEDGDMPEDISLISVKSDSLYDIHAQDTVGHAGAIKSRNQAQKSNAKKVSIDSSETTGVHSSNEKSVDERADATRTDSETNKATQTKVIQTAQVKRVSDAGVVKKGNDSSLDENEEKEEEWSDDGNAWLGCVCGILHGSKTHVFWIQCDSCQSWYNVAEKCVGFNADAALKVKEWLCWACGPPPETTVPHSGPEAKNKKDGASESNAQKDSNSQDTKNNSKDTEKQGKESGDALKFQKGEHVFVKEHAWPGVNNPEGVATVLAAYLGEDGNPLYDVKYVVGGKSKGIMQEYISLHRFFY